MLFYFVLAVSLTAVSSATGHQGWNKIIPVLERTVCRGIPEGKQRPQAYTDQQASKSVEPLVMRSLWPLVSILLLSNVSWS
jgi:hypothetical protein